MRIALLGDLHGAISLVSRTVGVLEQRFDFVPDAIVQVGDWGFSADWGEWPHILAGEMALPEMPIFVVHGNHEGREETLAAMAGIPAVPQLHVFPTGSAIWPLTVRDETVTLLGCGGAYDAPGTTPSEGIPFSERDPEVALERWIAAGEPPIDLLITHEAPTGCGELGEWRYGSPWKTGSPGIRTLWERVNPPLIVCGNYHREHIRREGSRTLRVLPLAQDGAAIWDTCTGQVTAFALTM
jgi:Icc-related predicted phosphoesterase